MKTEDKNLMRKINRRLPEHQKLRRAKGWRQQMNFGEFYIEDISTRITVSRHIDLPELATELEIKL